MVNYYYTNAKVGQRPKPLLPHKEFLRQLTEEGFMKMIDTFYTIVLDSPIAHYFPDNEDEIKLIKQRNGAYFMMMCGGDDRYLTRFGGSLDQIKMHEMFSITNKARIEWLGCWQETLEQIEDKVEHPYIQSYWNWLEVFSKHIVNYENNKITLKEQVKI